MTFPHLLLEMLLYREFSAAHYAQRAQTIRPMAALLRKKIFSCETQNVMFAFPVVNHTKLIYSSGVNRDSKTETLLIGRDDMQMRLSTF